MAEHGGEMPHEPSMMERMEMMAEDLTSMHMRKSKGFKRVVKDMAKRMKQAMSDIGGKRGMM